MPGKRVKTRQPKKPSIYAENTVAEGLMRIKEVVEFLGIGRSTVYELIADGKLASVQVGRSKRVPRKAVIQFAASRLSA